MISHSKLNMLKINKIIKVSISMTANRKTMIKALSTIIGIVEKSTTYQDSRVRFCRTGELAPLLAYELRNK